LILLISGEAVYIVRHSFYSTELFAKVKLSFILLSYVVVGNL